jgi:hypothetical protein
MFNNPTLVCRTLNSDLRKRTKYDQITTLTIMWKGLILVRFHRIISASSEADVIPTKCFVLSPWWRMKLAQTWYHPENILCSTFKENIYAYVMYFIGKWKTIYHKRRSETLVLESCPMWIRNSSSGQTNFLLQLVF